MLRSENHINDSPCCKYRWKWVRFLDRLITADHLFFSKTLYVWFCNNNNIYKSYFASFRNIYTFLLKKEYIWAHFQSFLKYILFSILCVNKVAFKSPKFLICPLYWPCIWFCSSKWWWLVELMKFKDKCHKKEVLVTPPSRPFLN